MIRSILILLTLAAAAGCSSSPAAPPAELVLDGRWVGDYAGGTLELEIPGPVVIDSGADVASGCRDLPGLLLVVADELDGRGGAPRVVRRIARRAAVPRRAARDLEGRGDHAPPGRLMDETQEEYQTEARREEAEAERRLERPPAFPPMPPRVGEREEKRGERCLLFAQLPRRLTGESRATGGRSMRIRTGSRRRARSLLRMRRLLVELIHAAPELLLALRRIRDLYGPLPDEAIALLDRLRFIVFPSSTE